MATITVTDPSDNTDNTFTAETEETAVLLAEKWLSDRHPETDDETGDLLV